MHRQGSIAAVFVLVAASAASAQVGQAWTDRGYASLNVGFETASGTLTDATTFRLYDENGSLSVSQAVDSGALFDISAGARVWRNVSVGIGYHRDGTTGEGSFTGSVPHPLIFNRNRSVAGAVSDLGRTERAVHLQLGYMLPLSDRLNVHVFLGPSFFSLKQDVIGDVTFSEQGVPFTSVNAVPAIAERSESATGFHLGADVSYQLLQTDAYKIGGGMFIRYAGATVDIPLLGSTVGSDVGGLQIGFGGRVRF